VTRRLHPALLSLVLLLELPWLGHRPLVRDEVISLEAGQRHLGALWAALHKIDAPVGLYYFLLHPWLQISTAAFWARLPSVLAMAGAVAVLTLTAERCGGRRAATLTALVLLANPATWAYATYARPYAMALLTAAVTLHVVLAAPRRAVLLFIAAVLTLYLQAMFVLLLIAEGIVALRRRAWHLVAALVAAGVLWLPLAFAMLSQTEMTSWIPLTSPSAIATEAHDLFGADGFVSVIGALLWVGLVVVALRGRLPRDVFLLGALPAATLVVAGFGLHVLGARYALYVVLTTGLALGLALAQRQAVPRALLAALGVMALASLVHEATLDYRQEDLPAAAAYIGAHDAAGDLLLYDPDYARAGMLPFTSHLVARDVAALPERDVNAVRALYLPEESESTLSRQVTAGHRIWVVGYPGNTWKPTDDPTDRVVRADLTAWRVVDEHSFGEVHVRLLERPT
jgi:mannosyltransferase